MNQTLPKLPDLSANIGTIRTEADTVAIQYFPRASSDGRLREFVLSLPVFAELTGCTLDLATPEPAWAENPKSKLVPCLPTYIVKKPAGILASKPCMAVLKRGTCSL